MPDMSTTRNPETPQITLSQKQQHQKQNKQKNCIWNYCTLNQSSETGKHCTLQQITIRREHCTLQQITIRYLKSSNASLSSATREHITPDVMQIVISYLKLLHNNTAVTSQVKEITAYFFFYANSKHASKLCI